MCRLIHDSVVITPLIEIGNRGRNRKDFVYLLSNSRLDVPGPGYINSCHYNDAGINNSKLSFE